MQPTTHQGGSGDAQKGRPDEQNMKLKINKNRTVVESRKRKNLPGAATTRLMPLLLSISLFECTTSIINCPWPSSPLKRKRRGGGDNANWIEEIKMSNLLNSHYLRPCIARLMILLLLLSVSVAALISRLWWRRYIIILVSGTVACMKLRKWNMSDWLKLEVDKASWQAIRKSW